MHRRTIIAAAPVLILSTLVSQRAPVLAQPASPVSGSEGGALYTYDSGEAGFFTKTYFYDTGREVVAFDAQFTPQLAEAAIASLREQTDNPITSLVITHPNPDKFNGAPAFQQEGAQVIASEATEAAIPGVHEYKKAGFVGMGMFTEETYPEQATVDETFTGTHTIELSDGKTVELSELSEPGVSSTQTVAFIPELNALIVGRSGPPQAACLAGGRHRQRPGHPHHRRLDRRSPGIGDHLRWRAGADGLRRTGRTRTPLGRRRRSDRLSPESRPDRHRLRGRSGGQDVRAEQ